jgi:hypothetical protein
MLYMIFFENALEVLNVGRRVVRFQKKRELRTRNSKESQVNHARAFTARDCLTTQLQQRRLIGRSQ